MDIQEIKNILYRYYEIEEDYDDENKGCYLNDKWLSINNIIKLLEKYY